MSRLLGPRLLCPRLSRPGFENVSQYHKNVITLPGIERGRSDYIYE